jgi:hypothetical protein
MLYAVFTMLMMDLYSDDWGWKRQCGSSQYNFLAMMFFTSQHEKLPTLLHVAGLGGPDLERLIPEKQLV